MKVRKIGGLALGMALGFAASTASALDVQGSWSGTIKCKVFSDGAPTQKVSGTVVAQVTQGGTAVNFHMEGTNGLTLNVNGNGRTISSAKDPNKGYMVTVDCGSGYEFGAAIEQWKAKVDPTDGTGKLKGLGLVTQFASSPDPSQMFVCKVVLERDSIADPGVLSCDSL